MNKKLDIESYSENGQRHGICELYHSDGSLWTKGTYVNGKPHGFFESYNTDGRFSYKCNYNNGVDDGYLEWGYGSKVFHLI